MDTWKPIPGQLMTRWTESVTPENAWREYPRPQLKRQAWLNLNGLWDYAITKRDPEVVPQFEGKILVPFPLESALSGVKRDLLPEERLWYRRSFNLPAGWEGQRVLLHFGAVDWEASVWVNGVFVGDHRGGYLPFCFEITKQIKPPAADPQDRLNEIIVAVWDPTDTYWQQRGKQVRQPKSIWYTPISGIWQTVWLEPVPTSYIERLKITPDIDTGSIQVELLINPAGAAPAAGTIEIFAGGKLEVKSSLDPTGNPTTIDLPAPRLWGPDAPFLYDLVVVVGQDRVESYFGMRKFSVEKDQRGDLRICLNHQPLFQYGPLEQGYWPDGLYTPPSEAALRIDLKMIKDLGCNMLRKHIKIEPACFYYECDRLGLIVWQDMPNGGKAVGEVTSLLAILFGSRRQDGGYRWAGREQVESREDFRAELQAMVDHLYHFPCIAVWVPFNEGWGQFDARQCADWLKSYDPTRLVDHASGWFDQDGGDFCSRHVYFKKLPKLRPEKHRAAVVSEFGGYSLKVPGHTWDPNSEFGYRKFASREELTTAYADLLESQLKPLIQTGLSAAIYTQAVDVEIEENGYLTYDREIEKMDFARLRTLHQSLYRLEK